MPPPGSVRPTSTSCNGGQSWGCGRALRSPRRPSFSNSPSPAASFVPGARGWKAQHRDLTRAHLTTPRVELVGRTWLELIREERLETWLEGRRSPTRRELFRPLATQLQQPAHLPPGIDDPLPPLRWLLGELADGQALTQTGNLNRAFVQAAATRFGWWDLGLHSLPRTEDELYDLLWRRTAAGLLLSDPFTLAAGEITLVVLLSTDTIPADDLDGAATPILHQEGWREQRTGAPPSDRVVSQAIHATTNLLRALNLLATEGDWRDRAYTLSPAEPSPTKLCTNAPLALKQAHGRDHEAQRSTRRQPLTQYPQIESYNSIRGYSQSSPHAVTPADSPVTTTGRDPHGRAR